MFERRLKIFLAIVGVMALVVLGRAAQLQLLDQEYWQANAAATMKRATLIEALRGPILDFKGRTMATDEPSIDAAVDYRAIIKDADWIKLQAQTRLSSHAEPKGNPILRHTLLKEEIAQVSEDIDAMWPMLAVVAGKKSDEIDEIKGNIIRQVELRRRFIWYKRYASAVLKHQEQARHESKDPPGWLKRLLLGESDETPQLDDFQITVSEETQAHVILRDITNDQFVELSKRLERCPGLVLRKSTHRHYAEPANTVCAQFLGHLGLVTKQILANDPYFAKEDELRQLGYNDQIGVSGLEKLFELQLRGTKGRVEQYLGHDDPAQTLKPIQGQAVRCTIDLDLQMEIMSAFKHVEIGNGVSRDELHGAAVVMDVASGEVRAMVSYPGFDLNTFDARYSELAGDLINKPLVNRATMDQFEPGSTAKTMIGATSISWGIMGVHEGIECTGYLRLPDPVTGVIRQYNTMGRCWVAKQYAGKIASVAHHLVPSPYPHVGHWGNLNGWLTVTDALERSCNVVFETIADRMGLAKVSLAFRTFGLGSRLGIGIEESPGHVPNPAHVPAWNVRAITLAAGIGQGQVLTTPIQMANVAATLARNGIWIRPHLLAGQEMGPNDRRDLGLSSEALDAVREGMVRVVNSPAGTGTQVRMSQFTVAGKTGSAQTGPFSIPARDDQGKEIYENGVKKMIYFDPRTANLSWYQGGGDDGKTLSHAWFIGFAPAENPKIAFAVLVEYGGGGGAVAGPIAKRLLEACMEHGYLAPTPDGARTFSNED